MPLYQRKPIIAIRDGDNYKLTDGLGNISLMPKKQFEALFEKVGSDDDIVYNVDDDTKIKRHRK